MHKGVIILVEAEDREDAINKVEDFLEPYGDGDVWDWYSIGNRWHNTLAPAELVKKFDDWVREEYKDVFDEHGLYSVSKLENEIDRPVIQAKWESLGLKGLNTYYSAYGFEAKDTEDDYNVIPLKDCIKTVKKWCKDLKKAQEEAWKEMMSAKKIAKKGKYDMSGYYAGKYADAVHGAFCFDSNVYNASESIGETVPDDIEGYWAVMIDMHN